jgi:hypothetical protein
MCGIFTTGIIHAKPKGIFGLYIQFQVNGAFYVGRDLWPNFIYQVVNAEKLQ